MAKSFTRGGALAKLLADGTVAEGPHVDARSIPLVHCRPPGAGDRHRAPIVYAHGNAEDLGQVVDWCRFLSQRLRRSVYVYDYEGYGLNASTATERSVYDNIASVVTYLTTVAGVRRLVLYGRSIGTAPALHEAARGGGAGGAVCGVVLQSAFKSVVSTYLPSKVVPRWCDILFNNRDIVACEVPVLLVHGTEDHIVPFGHALALNRAKCVWGHCWLKGAGHNDIELTRAFRETMCTSIAHFVSTVDPPDDQPSLAGVYLRRRHAQALTTRVP